MGVQRGHAASPGWSGGWRAGLSLGFSLTAKGSLMSWPHPVDLWRTWSCKRWRIMLNWQLCKSLALAIVQGGGKGWYVTVRKLFSLSLLGASLHCSPAAFSGWLGGNWAVQKQKPLPPIRLQSLMSTYGQVRLAHLCLSPACGQLIAELTTCSWFPQINHSCLLPQQLFLCHHHFPHSLSTLVSALYLSIFCYY